MTEGYRAVLFDFFGTLTHAIVRGPSHERIARMLGCEPARFTAVLDATFPARSASALGDETSALRAVARAAGGDPSPAILRAACAARTSAIRADIRIRSDAEPVLDLLRRLGYRIGVVTDCGPELPRILPELPIARYVQAAVYSIEAGTHKPDPVMYHTACARLGVQPHDCLYVGDGGSRELTGAIAAGLDAVRLVAPDLGNHLNFDVDTTFRGPELTCLTDVLDAIYARPSLTAVAVPAAR
jgi:putative hydrolase of the HAD superfamily